MPRTSLVDGSRSPALRIVNVSKRYGGVRALSEVSFDVFPGEVLGLVGDNGAGKSTLLKILSGVTTPTQGHVEIDGVATVFTSPADAIAAGISTVYQDTTLAAQQNVVANFFLGRELITKRWPGSKIGWLDRRTMYAATEKELQRLRVRIRDLNGRAGDLSGGQRQALAIARTAAWCERVLLLDEPTSALGVEQHREVLDLIERTRESGQAIILVSHQMPDIIEACDRVAILRLGQLVAVVDKAELSSDDLVGYITGSKTAGIEAT